MSLGKIIPILRVFTPLNPSTLQARSHYAVD
jgi:hypothetical protein